MSQHKATIRWVRSGPDFLNGQYSREHTWTFDGGITVPASAAPGNAPAGYINPAAIDPEEAFVAAISSCHMLTFLWLASKHGYNIESYSDEAIGVMTTGERGVRWVSTVTLNPKIVYCSDKHPSAHDIEQLHREAHEQ